MEFSLKDPQAIRCLYQAFGQLKKIGKELMIDASKKEVTFRSLNVTKSALPIVKFSAEYFETYSYYHDDPQVKCQLSFVCVMNAMKSMRHMVEMKFKIIPFRSILEITATDANEFEYTASFYTEDTVIVSAVYDVNDVVATIQCRFDIFSNLFKQHKMDDNALITICKRGSGRVLIVSTNLNDKLEYLTRLIVKKNGNCEVEYFKSIDDTSVSVSLTDFKVAVNIAGLFEQKIDMHLIGPGHPLIIKSERPGTAQFEMALATSIDEDKDSDDSFDSQSTTVTVPGQSTRVKA